ncbi:MAG TPA: hypothetical protein VKZ50_05335 [bacterium]|nr:hypothetical protein [bacterium]
MRRALAALAIGVTVALTPMAAMAHGGMSDDSTSVGYNGTDLAPADLLTPSYLDKNAQGDGNGQ